MTDSFKRRAAQTLVRFVEETTKVAIRFDQGDERLVTWLVGISSGAIALVLSSDGGATAKGSELAQWGVVGLTTSVALGITHRLVTRIASRRETTFMMEHLGNAIAMEASADASSEEFDDVIAATREFACRVTGNAFYLTATLTDFKTATLATGPLRLVADFMLYGNVVSFVVGGALAILGAILWKGTGL